LAILWNLLGRLNIVIYTKGKSGIDKIKDFFECYTLLMNVSDVELPNNGFLSNSDNEFNHSSE